MFSLNPEELRIPSDKIQKDSHEYVLLLEYFKNKFNSLKSKIINKNFCLSSYIDKQKNLENVKQHYI